MGTSAVAPLLGHLDVALSNYGKSYTQNALISDLLAPRVGVGRQTDKYTIADREGQRLGEKTLRAPGAPAKQIRMTESKDNYFCDSHALEGVLPDETEMIAMRRQGLTARLTSKLLLDKEVELAAIVTDTAQLTNNVTLAGASQFSDLANSDPIGVIEDAKSIIRLSGVEANTLVISDPVFKQLKKHPAILDRFKYVQAGSIGIAELQSAFSIPRILLAYGVKVDDAGAASFIWGKDMVLGYVQDSPSMDDLSFVKTFVWESAPGTVAGFGVITGRDPRPSAKAEIIATDFYHDQKITAVETGYLIKSAVA